ncbi:PREDICTED: uncharacterized protein LOC105456005 isoform X2 [Wasmannia auropunctata]|uniref:uncharacterized protein LOC105456005 isoform X2 n=1 Tax=Wasmannia auropunctata TaxID=64793 RepID=UPI0005EDE2B0|nr:PREDICTED: uncharacterized protein LOC105456005 isoform X2 [Wasmannia auropunctata]
MSISIFARRLMTTIRKKVRPQLCTDTSSNTITEQYNSRSASASSTSSCKLMNSIKEKRQKLLAQRLPSFIHEKSSDVNIIRDNGTLRHRKELSETDSKVEADVKVNDENVRCKDASSSAKDGCYCKDTDSIDLQQDSSCSTVPCPSFSACDNTRRPQSWIAVYPSKARARLDDSHVFLSRAICTNVERRNYRKNNDRDNVRGDDSEDTICHAVDNSRWLPKSIYTDCATYDENPEECFADSCKYRSKILRDSIINRNDIRRRQIGYKLLQQPLGSCQREQVARQWSTCSCIAEEEEGYCRDVVRDKKELPENICNVTDCPEKISVCRTSSKEFGSVRETSFGAPEKSIEETRACKDSAECSIGTSTYGTGFENSEELPKVTRVCKEFVTEEPPEDITVCKTVFGEPNGLPEEVIVYKALSDSKDLPPKETICKEIPNSNSANHDDVNRVSLNDETDKLVAKSTNNLNLSGPEGNASNKRIVKLNNKHDNVALNSFTRQAANVKQDKKIEETSNKQSKDLLNRIPSESIKDSKLLSKNVYSTLPRAQLYNSLNLASNFTVKKTSKTLANQRKTQSINRSMGNHFQESNNLSQNLTPNKNNQMEEKTRENSNGEEERQGISKEMKTTEDKQKESLLQRPFKKLIDVIKRGRTFITDRIEAGKMEAKKTIADDKKDIGKSEIDSEIEDKTNDIKDDIKDQQEIIKKVTVPMRPPQIEIADKEKKMDIHKTEQSIPKLLRIIVAKRSHILPTVVTTADSEFQESGVVSVSEIITTAHADQEKIPEEKVTLQEHRPAEVTAEIKTDDSIAPELSIAAIDTSVEDAPKDVADEDRIPQDILDETIKTYVVCPQKKPEGEIQKPILCQCGLPFEPNGRSCSIVKCVKDHVSCPQKKSEKKPQKFTLCKRELSSTLNNYSCSIVKCTKCNSTIEDCPCKDDRFEQKKLYCARCHLSAIQCTCKSYLKSCLKTDKPKFRGVSPLKISSHICTNCYRTRKERKCRKTTVCCHEECRCRCCATRGDCLRIIDKRKCGSQASCINCGRPRNQCCCTTFALVKRHKIKEGCDHKRTMICLHCDNPRDKCTCRAPIGKCSCCGLPSDVCNCQDDEGHAYDCERIVRRPDENRTIRVTSWKPKREIRRYFARNFEDFQSYSTEECCCYEKPRRQRPEELPYQRLNIFSEVMDELQQKMSESVCCARCWRNPCRCESPVDQDKRKEERKAENRVKRAEIEKSSRSKSPNNCRCSLNPRNERKSTVQKSIRHIGCVCKLTPCRCRKDRSSYKRPLAKCYYCKSLPCTALCLIRPNEVRKRNSIYCFFIAFFTAAALL